MNPAVLIAALICLAIGLPFLIFSIRSLKYRKGKPFQAKVQPSGDDTVAVKYKVNGTVYFKELPWKPPHPLARKPKPGQNVTLDGTLDNPTRMIYSRGGLESSFALKIVGLVIGAFFTLIGLFFLLLLLTYLIGVISAR